MPRFRPRTVLSLFAVVLTFTITWHILSIKKPLFISRIVGGPEHKYPFTYVGLPADAFNWTSPTRPSWLAPPPRGSSPKPVVLRFAIVSHPKEFDRRQAIREVVLANIPAREVKLEYYFFLGRTNKPEEVDGKNMSAKAVNDAVQREQNRYGDLFLLDMVESSRGLGEKRWAALQWASQSPRNSYDWFFTADTDSFVRFTALARRLATYKPSLRKPREQQILWGQMLVANRHWRDSVGVPESEKIETGDYDGQWYSGDESYEGPWYSYPVGLGYLISSKLVEALTAPKIKLVHNITYPYDDMVVGSWISDVAPEPATTIVDDWDGFHDPPRHGWKNAQVGWETVVVHHLNVAEMRAFRELSQWKGEWES